MKTNNSSKATETITRTCQLRTPAGQIVDEQTFTGTLAEVSAELQRWYYTTATQGTELVFK